MLPSVEEMSKVMHLHGLMIKNKNMFGMDYAKTLTVWSESFDNSWEKIKNLGFNETFKRMWRYYLELLRGWF